MGFILNKRGANLTTNNRTGTEVSTVVLMLPALQARQLTWEGSLCWIRLDPTDGVWDGCWVLYFLVGKISCFLLLFFFFRGSKRVT